MSNIGPDLPISNNPDKFGATLYAAPDGGDVAKEDRKRRVLAFLVDSRLALPRTALFRNLRYQGADFSEGSLKNYLRELREEGLVERIDAEKFAEGQVSVSDDDPGYWVATSDGRDVIESERSTFQDDIDTDHL